MCDMTIGVNAHYGFVLSPIQASRAFWTFGTTLPYFRGNNRTSIGDRFMLHNLAALGLANTSTKRNLDDLKKESIEYIDAWG